MKETTVAGTIADCFSEPADPRVEGRTCENVAPQCVLSKAPDCAEGASEVSKTSEAPVPTLPAFHKDVQ